MSTDPLPSACEECTKRTPGALVQNGADEYVKYFGGKAVEEISHFVCQFCGAKWLHRIESGVGGHGNFWEREP